MTTEPRPLSAEEELSALIESADFYEAEARRTHVWGEHGSTETIVRGIQQYRSFAARESAGAGLREALADANRIIAMTRDHLAKDHPDCAYTGLGLLNDASRAALASPAEPGLERLRRIETAARDLRPTLEGYREDIDLADLDAALSEPKS